METRIRPISTPLPLQFHADQQLSVIYIINSEKPKKQVFGTVGGSKVLNFSDNLFQC